MALFELKVDINFPGHPPFLAESVPDLADKILNKDVPPLRVKGSRVSGKASPDFQNLLNCLLKKNPVDRSVTFKS